MQDAGVIQPTASELAKLRQIESAARSYVAAQQAVWAHRQNPPDGPKETTYWISERDELADQVEEALVALAQIVTR